MQRFTLQGATGVTFQPHHTLCWPPKMSLTIHVRHIFINVSYMVRSYRCQLRCWQKLGLAWEITLTIDARHIKDVILSWVSTSIVCCFLHIPFLSARTKSLKQWDTSKARWQWVVLPCNFAVAVRRGVKIRNNSVLRRSFNKGTRLYPLVYRPSAPSLLLFFSVSPSVFLPRSVFLAFPFSVVCFLLLSPCFSHLLPFHSAVWQLCW